MNNLVTMEKIEPKIKNEQELGRKFQEDFRRLQNIAEVLKDLGLEVIDRFITPERLENPTSEMGFPLVMDGAQGIRASYSKRRGLKIWFTNGFENLNDPKRLEIEKRLKGEGLI